ncbi:Na+/H+ antiporter subunit G [Shewanella sp. Actino-trap-3]|jgi:multicomponent Na+:H+ antiporter subunit G|uniref:cation:proton antiporter n=1 Tax=unclassified Shewanella TaxID=196818 RepID=UPI000C32B049|nr:monovalent cation/H(+) antiporter subunit G [Shewanella sp. Actino-trap-3]PKG78580.1 Na+/H+ antiporter subunit G [Shewanella sp. Actino-trap-3]|tara:strand:+ start:9945 stop:10256 length:312 start_codon:yes stop_codon:yes gene_type:complete
MNIADSFSLIFCLVGLFFFFAGTVGLIRFPNVLSRLHAITKADNLGLGLIVIGLLPQLSSPTDALKLILIWGLVIFSSAACSYLIASQVIEEQSPPHSVEDKS